MTASLVGFPDGDKPLEDAIAGGYAGFVYRSVDRTGLFGIPFGRTMIQPNNGNGRGREGEGGRVRLERKTGRRGRTEY